MSTSMIVRAVPRPGQDTRLKTLAAELVEKSRQEPGVIRYEAMTERGGSVVMLAEYADDAAFEAHLGQPYTREFKAALKRIAEGSAATVTPLARFA
ncbi:putative quinol monooxygenase [Salipiger pallidus]|nr:putative quinol monooxygenase [Salipiger pallidus]